MKLIDKETIHKILSSLWKNDDNVGKMCYNKALQDAQIAFDSMQEEPVNKVDVDDAMAEVEAKAKTFTESYKGESSDEILAQMRGEEPVSEDLENAALEYATHYDKNWSEVKDGYIAENEVEAFKAGAKWQKEQMMASGTDVTVHVDAGGYPYIPQIELYDYDKDIPLAKEGDKYKVVLIYGNSRKEFI